MSMHVHVLLALAVWILAACAPRANETSVVQELDCATDTGFCRAGYTYTANGPDGRRLGQYGNFGGVGDYGRGPAWSATVTSSYQPGGCLVFGPYEAFASSQIYLTGEVDVEGEGCNGRTGACGSSYWQGYTGAEYDDSSHTRANSFVVDMVGHTSAGVQVFGSRVLEDNKNIPFQTVKLESGLVNSSVSSLEIRVCDLKPGKHHRKWNCSTTIHGIEHCNEADYVNNFRVSVSQIKLTAFYDNPNN